MKNSGIIAKNGGNNHKSNGLAPVNNNRMKNKSRMGSGGGGLSLQASRHRYPLVSRLRFTTTARHRCHGHRAVINFDSPLVSQLRGDRTLTAAMTKLIGKRRLPSKILFSCGYTSLRDPHHNKG